MNCATSTLKYVLFVFNVLCALVGLSTVIICALALRSIETVSNGYCIAGIVIGTIAFLISFFGCCGAIREMSTFMWIYAVLLLILLVTQIAIVVSFHGVDLEKIATDGVKDAWAELNTKPEVMAKFETNLECCGLNSFKDYNATNLPIPNSCYSKDASHTDDHLFTIGCLERMIDVCAYLSKAIKITFWTMCGIEITALIFACILARSFSRNSGARYVHN